jgi:hypothetical protein
MQPHGKRTTKRYGDGEKETKEECSPREVLPPSFEGSIPSRHRDASEVFGTPKNGKVNGCGMVRGYPEPLQ